jgi:SARP family transcriptional regulator, regulator of embCAB operon
MNIDIKILGPFEASVAGVSIVPTANKPSQLLAILALNAGRLLTVDTLTEELWNESPPRTATTVIQTYILKLRRRFREVLEQHGHSPHDILLTRRSGYLLNVSPDNVDAVMYDRLSAMGQAAVDEGDFALASRTLNAALRLWRGSALADVPAGPHLRIEAVRLEESRLTDLSLRIDADLCLGRHHQLVSELATLCARYPLLENFCAQFMIALYRSDRQWQAMRVYRQTRDTLVDQLGVEPSPRLCQLHQAMLAGHPTIVDPGFVYSSWVPNRQPNSATISLGR